LESAGILESWDFGARGVLELLLLALTLHAITFLRQDIIAGSLLSDAITSHAWVGEMVVKMRELNCGYRAEDQFYVLLLYVLWISMKKLKQSG
jgi:hypothetical protein